ncbi:MAG: thioredoxin-dependent thiol peroxidase [Floccifex porci]|mgnify:CR=1 FL=1|uniref:thioredoxin-dependent peroxiredoxin n=1 Tax=Floccifex porci TaxID=2606629 RepID=A0A7X2N2X8_9FIRM|nr:thioredoxin-dependent thiol peroxidase [Floccifex porci]MCI7803414.1 thioredoxin-dependent thiol peroxidase [Erysipelotrichaceae bacterium]MDD7466958.1 thioredoxin-dependent thiol peroxidase [Floccifex porci]MDO4480797.1 thioredoxin-dependent thiol peroxidase [Erysipelotrichaceae bacterium]MDY4796440.1 thioredoxin-dependent thiol peroxidase [Floccifex porci]MSS01512.1 thioredoxin-dependent thiol peroxidase [Floccifex porci]
MLEVGSKAPDFTLQDQDGNLHSLSDYKGQKVLLYFYPKDNTAGCTKQACAYSQLKSEFLEKGIQIIGLSKDSVKSHKNFEQKQNLDITLLSDENLDVISSYDVWHEKKMCGKTYMGVVRTTYVIDENGIIIFSNDKVKAAQDAQKMLETVK